MAIAKKLAYGVCFLALFFQFSLGKWDSLSLSTSGQRIRLSDGFGTISNGTLNISAKISTSNSNSNSHELSSDLEEHIKDDRQNTPEQWFYLVIYTEDQHKNIMYYRSNDPCIQESYYVTTQLLNFVSDKELTLLYLNREWNSKIH